MKKYYLDLHLHSKYSRAVSRDMDLAHIEESAKKKGIDVVGTGDFTHPQWFDEIKKLKESGPGIYQLSENSPSSAKATEGRPVSFVLSGEISCIYNKNNRTRKIHLVVLPTSIPNTEKINTVLSWIGNVKSDGRPILGIDAKNLAEEIWKVDREAVIIPAHIWTPWFSLYGSASGFDSISECFEDLSNRIYALETGLSSDPEMNWRIPEIRSKILISNSDAHSAEKMGRELTVLETNEEFSLPLLSQVLREGYKSEKGKVSTVEFYPEEGKYHYDGHRNCKIVFSPQETAKAKGICPKCNRPLTVGVLNRVEKIAGANQSLVPEGATCAYAIPLKELIGQIENVGASSKSVQDVYNSIVSQMPEIDYLLESNESDLNRVGNEDITQAILAMRAGEVERTPGYDGEFGIIRVKIKPKEAQKSLF